MTTTPQAALLSRAEIDALMTEHYPLDSLLRENVDVFEACIRDAERAILAKLQATLPQIAQPIYLFAEFDGKPDHILKTDPDAFDAVAAGLKTHEIRKDDRGFKVGDKLLLKRTRYTGRQMHMSEDPYPLEYTGEEVRRVVSHIQLGYGLGAGWVILSFAATQAEPVQAAFKALADSQVQIDPEIAKATAEGFWTLFEPAQAGELPDEREAFEAWASNQSWFLPHMTRRRDMAGSQRLGQYIDPDMLAGWSAWQARAALSARKPLTDEQEARELVAAHQKAVFELAKDMSDDNHRAVISARLALLHKLCPNGIGLEVKP